MNNIYSLSASQEAQPLQKTMWITYFVQIHKLDKAASPTTYKNKKKTSCGVMDGQKLDWYIHGFH